MAGQCGRICRSWGGSIRMGIMVGIQDFESCETSGQFYGGNAGRKIGLVWRDGDWLVKFPRNDQEPSGQRSFVYDRAGVRMAGIPRVCRSWHTGS